METQKAVILKKSNILRPTICSVCCAKATGNHYEVDSCTGCKSFFKRTSISGTVYTCKLTGKCFDAVAVDEAPPRCRACRYEKCKKVGMNTERFRFDPNVKKILKQPNTIESDICALIKQLMSLDIQYNEEWRVPIEYPTLRETIDNHIFIKSIPDTVPNHLANEVQRNSFELFITIEFIMRQHFYNELSENDKYLLVRDTLFQTSYMTMSFFSFEHKSDKQLRYTGKPEDSSILPLKFHLSLQNDISIRCLLPFIRLKITNVEFTLLRAILIANPNVEGLTEEGKKILTNYRNKYTMSLLYHTMSVHQKPDRFASLISILNVLAHQQKDLKDIATFILLYAPDLVQSPVRDCITFT